MSIIQFEVDFLIQSLIMSMQLMALAMEFEKGKTYGLVGESGCGKSTTGKAIIGLEKITSGHIIYEGEDVTNKRRNRNSCL